MKKLILLFCLLLTLLCLLCACDEGGTSTEPSSGGDANTEEGTGDEGTGGDEGEPSHTHSYGAWSTTTTPTCTTAGVKTRTCPCGVDETQAVAATGEHSYNTSNVCTVCDTPLPYTDGLAYTLNSDGESYSVKEGTATATDIVIPHYYNEKPVTDIGDHAFDGCALTSVVLPSTVTSIGEESFAECMSLTSIMIPSSVMDIGRYAFYQCISLRIVTISEGVKSIGKYAFLECVSLPSVTISSTVTSIGEGAFIGCSGLESITVASDNTVYHSAGNCLIETASKTLIAGCKTSDIPTDDSVTSIGEWAFGGCDSLTSVTFETTEGWWHAYSSDATSGTSLSATDLADTSTAATYLKNNYRSLYWKRTASA